MKIYFSTLILLFLMFSTCVGQREFIISAKFSEKGDSIFVYYSNKKIELWEKKDKGFVLNPHSNTQLLSKFYADFSMGDKTNLNELKGSDGGKIIDYFKDDQYIYIIDKYGSLCKWKNIIGNDNHEYCRELQYRNFSEFNIFNSIENFNSELFVTTSNFSEDGQVQLWEKTKGILLNKLKEIHKGSANTIKKIDNKYCIIQGDLYYSLIKIANINLEPQYKIYCSGKNLYRSMNRPIDYCNQTKIVALCYDDDILLLNTQIREFSFLKQSDSEVTFVDF